MSNETFAEGTNLIANRLFEAIKPDHTSIMVNVAQLADSFLRDTAESPQGQENGLLAYLFVSVFPEELSKQQRDQLKAIVMNAKERHGVVEETLDHIQILNQEVRDYFNHKCYPYAYFQVPLVSNQLAMSIIGLQAHRIAAQMRRELEEKKLTGMVVEAFVNPRSGQPGVWMSTQGVRFDPAKLRAA